MEVKKASALKSSDVSSTTTPTKVEKCALFKSINKRAVWLRKQPTDDLPLVNTILDDFQRHLNSGCFCASRSATYTAMAVTFLEKFLLMFQNSVRYLSDIEIQLKKTRDQELKIKEEGVINDLDLKEESSFVAHYNENVNQANFNRLTNVLLRALEMFTRSFNLNKTENLLTCTFVEKLGVLNHLNLMFQIFIYYGLDIYAFQANDLALAFIDQFYPSKKTNDPEDIIMTQCNMIRLLLKLGLYENARVLYRQYFCYIKFDDIKTIDSYGYSYVFLLYCELCLRARNGKKVAQILKDFINGEYLQKCTIKRYLIKAQAFLLASRFPSITYQFEPYFNEFVDPIQMSVGICRRWHFFQEFFTHSDDGNAQNVDPWWLKFHAFNLFSESFDQFVDFHFNNGLTTDHVFYHKIAVNLYTVTLNLISLSKLQLISAKYDTSNGFLIDARFKLILFKRIYTKSVCNERLFTSNDDQQSISDQGVEPNQTNDAHSNDDSLVVLLNDLLISSQESGSGPVERNVSTNKLYQCYKQLMIEARAMSTPNEDDAGLRSVDICLDNPMKTFLEDFRSVNLPVDLVMALFHQYLWYFVENLIIDYEETKNPKLITEDRYRFLLNFFEHSTMDIYLVQLNDSIKSNRLKIKLQSSMEEQLTNGPISNLFWFWSDQFSRIMISNGSGDRLLPLLSKLTEISAYCYRNRMYRSKMFYYRALIMFEHLKKTDPNSFSKKRKIYQLKTHIVHEKNHDGGDDGDKIQTPPLKNRHLKRSKNLKPMKAPLKADLISGTAKKYGLSLLQKISESTATEGTRKNALDFDEHENLIDSNETAEFEVQPVHKRKTKNGKKTKKNVAVADDPSIVEQPFSIYTDSKSNDVDQEYLATIKLFSKLSIEPDQNQKEGYFETTFQKPLVEEPFTLDDIRQILKKIICYIGSHPSRKLYEDLHYFYYQLYKCSGNSSQLLAYHLSETANYHAFRCRCLFNSLKKLNNAKPLEFDVDMMRFKSEDFTKPLNHELPKTWRMVQIRLIENGTQFPDLLLCRFQTGCRTFFMKIKNNLQKVTKFFLDEFNEIMKMNSVSIFETEKNSFWKMRFEYDSRLKCLLESTEQNIFGLARGIFLGYSDDREFYKARYFFRQKVLDLAREMHLECADQQLLDIVCESMVLMKPEETELIAKHLFDTERKEFISRFNEYRKKCFAALMKPDRLEKLFKDIGPVGLIIDSALNQFPFESMPTFRRLNQPFFRMPSMRVAQFLYKKFHPIIEKGIDDEKTFYILNPGNNLENTEKFFKDKLQSIKEWNGFVGTIPDGKVLEENLETKDIYLFMGHGSGSQYYRNIPNGIDSINIRSVSMVVGCSSGRVTKQTKNADTFGTAYRFLANGSPTYIGTLWDITDKDIDIYFDQFMSVWFKRWTPLPDGLPKLNSLCRSLSVSRDACKLKHLIGCAPIVYGLPIESPKK